MIEGTLVHHSAFKLLDYSCLMNFLISCSSTEISLSVMDLTAINDTICIFPLRWVVGIKNRQRFYDHLSINGNIYI